jgi:hypothetical protein
VLLKCNPALLRSGKPFLLLKIEIRAEKPTTQPVENVFFLMPGGLALKAVCNAVAHGCTTLYKMLNRDNKMTNAFWLSGMIRTSLLPLATMDPGRVQGLPFGPV